MQSLRFALQPVVKDVSVTWDLPKGVSVTVLSPPITAVFQGQRSLVYAQISGQVGTEPPIYTVYILEVYVPVIYMVSNILLLWQSSAAAEGCVMVKYSLAGLPSQNQLHFSLKPAEDTG